jgi:hypothetical protein
MNTTSLQMMVNDNDYNSSSNQTTQQQQHNNNNNNNKYPNLMMSNTCKATATTNKIRVVGTNLRTNNKTSPTEAAPQTKEKPLEQKCHENPNETQNANPELLSSFPHPVISVSGHNQFQSKTLRLDVKHRTLNCGDKLKQQMWRQTQTTNEPLTNTNNPLYFFSYPLPVISVPGRPKTQKSSRVFIFTWNIAGQWRNPLGDPR